MILGPTSVGKTALSIAVAKAIRGEIISADSRQVYRGLNIGTGKATKREMRGVRHHLIDVIEPKKVFSASDYVREGRAAISEIAARGNVPIIVGGTGFYIYALVGTMPLAEAPPNNKLRKELEKESLKWLNARLKKLDPRRLKTIDTKNPVRLIRAIEIATALGKVPKTAPKKLYDISYIGLTIPPEELKKKIYNRLFARIRQGMLGEAKRLRAKGLSWKRMEELGLEYRFMARHLQGKITKTQFLQELEREINNYGKRQMTWFKKNKDILWFSPKDSRKIIALSKKFLTVN